MPLLLIPLAFLVLLYALVVVPQQRRVRAHDELVRSLEVGQEVMTTSGIYGRLVGLDDEFARLETTPGIEMKIARASVGLIVPREQPDRPERTAPPHLGTADTAASPSETADTANRAENRSE
ncbi:MAG: preprotein translocase subunit YajC [Actinobacteria bacterium]|nr:preprotein translocase subunit YajC [Actinomycetota bacterium]